MQFEIRSRWSGAVVFTAEIAADSETPTGIKLGLAVKTAVKAGANLRVADLSEANLRGANLTGANPRGARIIHLAGLPSGETIFMPTPTGWYLTVGCWEGNLEDFKTLIASDEGWPEARGDEVTRRRPSLQAVAALCEAHMRLHPKTIEELAEKWQETDGLGVDRG